MNALGKYLLGGRLQAVGIVSFLTVISLLVPPFSYIISGAPVSLLTLRKGPGYSVQIMLGALVLVTLFGQFSGFGVTLGPAVALGIWTPVWACSLLLRVTESQGMLLLAVAGTGAALVLGSYLYDGQLALLWQSWRDRFLEQGFSPTETVQLQQVFDAALPLLNGIIAAGMAISLVITVLLARWWQSRLFNPGGFREEFQRLLLPLWLTVFTLVLVGLSVIDTGDYQGQIRNLMIVLVVVHVFQGIASAHRTVSVRNLSPNWLIAMYVFLLILPQMTLFVACIGMVDVWSRHRKTVPDDGV